MAVMTLHQGHEPVTEFDQWYVERREDPRTGELDSRGFSPFADMLWHKYENYKREMDMRVHNFYKLEILADGEVITKKPDLPNISSGETAGIVRRIARNLVQHTPNLEVVSRFDDDTMEGVFTRHILTTKIVGDDLYSNDMQQNLFSSTKTAFTLGFDCVLPVLLQDAGGGWYVKYDSIHYRDVFPEPGARDVRQATSVFIRRYLTKGEIYALIENNTAGWDIAALRTLCKNPPRAREMQSVAHQDSKHHTIPDGYELITWYSSSGDPFLTFSATTKLLLRVERNKHPLKWHPVHFLVLEKDDQQPLGKSQVELLVGRQEFQDLMLNGAMKMWYRNINPSIIGYGAVNSIPNLSPGKYTSISNPNAKIEPFEVNTQTLMQYGQISQQNMGSMVALVGAADQQMALQSGGQTQGMSATPQGVEAQQQMVDITTNNYQKAIESFFSHYCSYALTIYFQELKGVKEVQPTADTRRKLLGAGLDPERFNSETGSLEIDFSRLAVEYWVRCVPGSLVEMEDEKQIRILKEMFVPLSQAMPAIAASQDQRAIQRATQTMEFIIEKMIELSGASSAAAMKQLFKEGHTAQADDLIARGDALEESISQVALGLDAENEAASGLLVGLQQQVSGITEILTTLMDKLGVNQQGSTGEPNNPREGREGNPAPAGNVEPARARPSGPAY